MTLNIAGESENNTPRLYKAIFGLSEVILVFSERWKVAAKEA